MNKKLFTHWLVLLLLFCPAFLRATVVNNPTALTDLVNRVGGSGTSARISFIIDDALAVNGKDAFTITSDNGKPCIKANNVNAGATGFNWYLNHYAHVNISWNQLTTDLSKISFPVPTADETHSSAVDYRYNFNYCTFSYSCAVWSWERWEKEIDWMALHGINLPLQAVGVDVVWMKTLLELGYTKDEANAFIAGPAFQGWWLMDNLEGHGGKNPDWWYTRQEKLCKNIMARERELGMSPVVPGYSSMVPFNITTKKPTWQIIDTGTWAGGFQRPAFLDPTKQAAAFKVMSTTYYKYLNELMGICDFYSMDPFHEGGGSGSADLQHAYTGMMAPIDSFNPKAVWVIQAWGSNPTGACLSTMKKGKLLVLDLFADGYGNHEYSGHDKVFCMLHNFGGRVGMHGRLEGTINNYYSSNTKGTRKGLGATMEGIETNPMMYDALFELPWRPAKFDVDNWITDYTKARYNLSASNPTVDKAWLKLKNTIYNCQTNQHGTSEPIICARPGLIPASVSTWVTASIYHDRAAIRDAVSKMLSQGTALSGNNNYGYDLADMTRQTLTDCAYSLLESAKATQSNKAILKNVSNHYLGLMLDIDSLLNSRSEFKVGSWLSAARAIADEESGTTAADKTWLEWNARMLITTWTINDTNLRDYSNRAWGGIIKDYYYPRWKAYFNQMVNGAAGINYYNSVESVWRGDGKTAYTTNYSATPVGDTYAIAKGLFSKYMGSLTMNNDSTLYFCYNADEDKTSTLSDVAYRTKTYQFKFTTPAADTKSTIYADWNNDGNLTEDEATVVPAGTTERTATLNIPATAVTGNTKVLLVQNAASGAISSDFLKLTDGTMLAFNLLVKDDFTASRTVKVATENTAHGSVSIVGSTAKQVTNAQPVQVKATAASSFDFLHWTDAKGTVITKANPYTYYGKDTITLVARFIENKWKTPTENLKDLSTIQNGGQYANYIGVIQNGKEKSLYSTSVAPTVLNVTTPNLINAPAGTHITIKWTSKGGLNYCNLSAYLDTNADGDFNDKGEFLAAIGKKSSADNPSVANGTLAIALPETMPLGITHIRFRFDSSWAKGYLANGAMAPDTVTQRMVYDILLNITDLPSDSITTTTKADNTTHGSAEILGQGLEITTAPGVEVVFQALPFEGFQFSKWTDMYGKVVSTTPDFRIIPLENNTYIANFVPATGITGIDGNESSLVCIYDINGKKVTAPTKGVYVKVYKNKKSEKVEIK